MNLFLLDSTKASVCESVSHLAAFYHVILTLCCMITGVCAFQLVMYSESIHLEHIVLEYAVQTCIVDLR